ncbi:MAG: S24/S26 family peptidase, partial [Spirochaetaceae bacterium]|nr:S24/S26 family peptidase [Spirochaetaceae bacterium]
MASNVSGIEYSFFVKQHRRRNETFLFCFILIIFLVCSFWQKFLLFPVSVSSDSMNPLVDSGDVVMVTPLASIKPVEGRIPVLSS